MFAYLLYKSPLWVTLDLNSRLLRIFIASIAIYVIIHAILFSNYLSNEKVNKFKKIIYYIVAIDTMIMGRVYNNLMENIPKKLTIDENKFIEYISTIGKNNLIEHTPKNKENIETKNLKEEESIPIYNSKYI